MILPFDAVGEGHAVVLLHAGVADRTMWQEHLEPLAESGRRAIALDLPGFGEAGLEPGPQSPWEDVLQTLRVLTGERVTLVGNSYGGAVAMRVAAVAPAQVSAL
ncbi:MAG TPA: alpha/beta fold hydrolase, partial [Solirubrobacteraceae bacterium]|nr:alpha/beta fold hydrolase [Solirubrobacteraceae bacterium]